MVTHIPTQKLDMSSSQLELDTFLDIYHNFDKDRKGINLKKHNKLVNYY